MTLPVPNDPHGPVVVCQRCGVDAPAGTTNCPRCGAFVPANEGNLRHGLRRYQTTGVLPPDLKTDIDTFRANVISDQGGLAELPAIRAGLIRLLIDAEVGRRLMFREVVNRGVDSKPGRMAYDRLLSTMDRWMRLAVALGLERRQRDVMTLSDYINAGEPETGAQTATVAPGEAHGMDREVVDVPGIDAPSGAGKDA